MAQSDEISALASAYPRAVSSSPQRKALWVEVRNSETGQRTVDLYAAPVPRTRADRERFLNRYIPAIFPGANLRRYAGGAATFVAGHLLIQAHYAAVRDDAALLAVDERLPEPIADGAGQGSLFAA